jgi:MoaA/NifB/PqqE/SkfB family radical SAM enzyme
MSDILKKYVCTRPFTHIEVTSNEQLLCCASWLPIKVNSGDIVNPNNSAQLIDDWKSPIATDIRRSVMDGTYKYCDKVICPFLNKALNTGEIPSTFIPIKQAEKLFGKIDELELFTGLPQEINFIFDNSCNLKCPTCRSKLIPNEDVNSPLHIRRVNILKSIEMNFAKGVKRLIISGSADPIYSKIFRNFLVNFNKKSYPKLSSIKLFTNGNLLTEKMWNSMNAKEMIDDIEISIDAGTKETYENVTRLNGNWDNLIENLRFLSTVKTIKLKVFSMIVTEYNYKEMKMLADIILDIFKDDTGIIISYRQISYWSSGAYTREEVKNISVFDPSHSKHDDFIEEFEKVLALQPRTKLIHHSFHHVISKG